MTRRWLAVRGGLLVGLLSAAVAYGEYPRQPRSLAERIAAYQRGWTEAPPAPSRSAVRTASHDAAKGSPSEPAGFPQIDPRSLLPTKLFGRGGNQPAGSGRQNRAPARQQTSAGEGHTRLNAQSPTVRTASTSREGSAKAGVSYGAGFTLPGLGRLRPTTPSSTASDREPTEVDSMREPDLAEDYQETRPNRGPGDEIAPGQAPRSAGTRPSAEPGEAPDYDRAALRRDLTGFGASPTRPQAGTPEPEPADFPGGVSNSDGDGDQTPRAAIGSRSTRNAKPLASSRSSSRIASAGPGRAAGRDAGAFAAGRPPLGGGDDVLVAHQTPVITSDIRGPKQILIGREATYELRLRNQGDVAAEAMVASIRIPSWADVVDTSATRGTVRQAQSGDAPAGLEWQIQRLDAGATESLEVKLIPRSGRPLELGVTWTYAPVGSRAVVEVQEPKLRMHVSGPDEVLFGKPQLYRLTLTNPGTGTAENVNIDLLPPGGGDGSVTSHRLGDIAQGTSKSIEVELTPREAGKLSVKATASAEGGLTSDVTKDIFCRKPELEVDWRGPDMTYAGTEATYFLRVRNPGTAAADDVAVTATLPEGVELISASEGQAFDPDRGEVMWRVGSLRPGDDFYMELKCTVNNPGTNQLRIAAATAAGDLTDSVLAETNVVALADLQLDVTDPAGPVPVGEEAVYEIHVQNRGANKAEEVNIVALFSDGVEPFAVEGAQYAEEDGRVTFHTIDTLPAGRQIVLRIRARAVKAGMHVFRAEVLCRDLEIKLAAEETTRFFDSASLGQRSESYEATETR